MSSSSSSASAGVPPTKVITIENASACNAYELRQELNRRNAFDINPDTANYRTMLQRLMIELVKEEEEKQAEKMRAKEQEANEAREKAKREREAKKAEALERSRQRREADPEYFQRRQQVVQTQSDVLLNVTGQKESEGENVAKGPLVEEIGGEEDSNGNGEERELDPFRAYKPSGRNRVFVK